ncbi:hypothetical protein TRIUR3_25757 [Triticum urartu]|uniref:DUF4220 domain-containing protein n=1 Tax=Triticum urartu TaxID=4572 RepID=M7YLD7_TRIUA|nr:hypothetical protein TRIUR3_25757 [Triticum urartu]
MAGNGSESFTSRFVDPELIPRGPEEEMVVQLALRRTWEEALGLLPSGIHCLRPNVMDPVLGQPWWPRRRRFTLQAFFLFAAGIRRRNKSAVLRILLWLAYLSADYVAVFVLGHLTMKMDDPLVLLWAPVLLLHLGGQETITAFSMEDNELWKRHLLGLLTQVAMAVYVVAKSWRSSNGGGLVAPVALMFVSGTVKYNQDIVGRQKWWLQEEYADLVQAAGDSFPNCMNALMDIPVSPWVQPHILGMAEEIQSLRGPAGAGGSREDTFPSRAYKLVEIQLSLMYDHLYTKVGLRYAQRWPVVGLGLPLLTFATTLSALALFAAAARKKGSGAVDVAVSYVLLAGAVALEVLSILTVTLSFRSYCFLRDKLGAGGRLTPAVFWLVRCLRPYDKPLWSNKWAQYNLLAGCIKEKQAGVFTRAMRRVGLAGDTELRRISDETKALICNELDDERRLHVFSHARGTAILSLSGHGVGSQLHKSISKVDFSTSVVMWHLVTDMCFFLGGEPARDGRRHMALAREVSSYLMDLVMERRVLISSEGHVAHRKARDEVEIKKEHQVLMVNKTISFKKKGKGKKGNFKKNGKQVATLEKKPKSGRDKELVINVFPNLSFSPCWIKAKPCADHFTITVTTPSC